jgi:hypothetical protein
MDGADAALPRLNGDYTLTEMEALLRDRAAGDLDALDIFERSTTTLAFMLQGLHVPPHPDPAPPTVHIKSAVLNLSVIALRSARAVGVLVCSGYEPEAQSSKRRLSEAHARLQAVTKDRSGQHAQRWLEGKGPSTPRKLAGQYGDLEIFDLFSEATHASFLGLRTWSIVDMDDGQRMVLPQPHRRVVIANATFVDAAIEARDFAAAIGTEFSLPVPGLQRLDADLLAAVDRHLAPGAHEDAA